MNKTRICKWCTEEKPLGEFKNKINCKEEFGVLCAECRPKRNAANRKNYAKDGTRRYSEQVDKRKRLFAEPLPEGHKRCHTCCNVKPENQFWIKPNKTTRIKGGPSNYCTECRDKRRTYMQNARKTWTEERREHQRCKQREIAAGIKRTVIEHYGGKCECCGDAHIDFLTLDHINGDGAAERAGGINGSRFYRSVIRRGFPDTYRCLCWNCNWSNFAYGYCPHRLEKITRCAEWLSTPIIVHGVETYSDDYLFELRRLLYGNKHESVNRH